MLCRRSHYLRPAIPTWTDGVHFAIRVGPFLSLPQPGNQLLEGRGVCGREFESRQEVERLSEVSAMVKPPGQRRQVA
jgi:hypothetical protein